LWLLSLGAIATTLVVSRALWLMRPSPNPGENRAPVLAIGSCLALALAALLVPWLWPALREALLYSLSPGNSWALAWPLLVAALLVVATLRLADGAALGLMARFRSPARRLSLALKRRLQPPTAPRPMPTAWLHAGAWRDRERRWNRLWQQGTVTVSAWLLGVLLLLGWLW